MIYLELFLRFFQTGLFSVGGGLATLPFLYEISNQTHWFSHADIADMIAISESTPGAIGINMSTYAGYITGGIFGGILATLSLAMPSVIIILIIARLLEKFENNPYVAKAFYGLRPASIAMISAAGINVVKRERQIRIEDCDPALFGTRLVRSDVGGGVYRVAELPGVVCVEFDLKRIFESGSCLGDEWPVI